MKAHKKATFTYWAYWLLLHLERNVFPIDEEFEKNLKKICTESNQLEFHGDAASVRLLSFHSGFPHFDADTSSVTS